MIVSWIDLTKLGLAKPSVFLWLLYNHFFVVMCYTGWRSCIQSWLPRIPLGPGYVPWQVQKGECFTLWRHRIYFANICWISFLETCLELLLDNRKKYNNRCVFTMSKTNCILVSGCYFIFTLSLFRFPSRLSVCIKSFFWHIVQSISAVGNQPRKVVWKCSQHRQICQLPDIQ